MLLTPVLLLTITHTALLTITAALLPALAWVSGVASLGSFTATGALAGGGVAYAGAALLGVFTHGVRKCSPDPGSR